MSIVLTIPVDPTTSARPITSSRSRWRLLSTFPTPTSNSDIVRASTPGMARSMSAATWSARADVGRLDEEAGDRLLLEVQEHPGRRDVHDDRAVQEHRARLVEADDREGLMRRFEAGYRPRAAGQRRRETPGGLRADDDMRLALVAPIKEPAAAPIRGQELAAVDIAPQAAMLGEVLPLDLDEVKERLEVRLTRRVARREAPPERGYGPRSPARASRSGVPRCARRARSSEDPPWPPAAR